MSLPFSIPRCGFLPLVLVAAVLPPGPRLHAQDTPPLPGAAEVVKKTEQWITTRRLISEEAAAWQAEQATLGDLNAIRSREIEELDQFIAAAGDRVGELERQKSGQAEERNELRKWRGDFENRFAKLEAEVKNLTSRFPLPLRDKTEESLLRLESENSDRALQDRVRDVLIILQAAKEFDEQFTVTTEVRDFGDEKREVSVLYLGLSQAWYVDAPGAHSGYGLPGADGWKWTEDPSIAARVRRAIDIQTGQAMAAFVDLPFVPSVGKEGAE